ncbi:MAG: hypothetical protein AAGJ83_09370 [Planctomycetota bacterium]
MIRLTCLRGTDGLGPPGPCGRKQAIESRRLQTRGIATHAEAGQPVNRPDQPQEHGEEQQLPFFDEAGSDNPPEIKRRTGWPVSG